MRRKHIFALTIVCLFAPVLTPGRATAGPGPVVAGFIERVETHSKAPNSDYLSGASQNYGSDTYLYSNLFLARRLGDGVTGMLSYINKYGIDDNDSLANIGSVTLQQDLRPHWKGTYTCSFVSNPERAVTGRVLGRTASNWYNLGGEFNNNPGAKRKYTWKAGFTYNTAADFANGQTTTFKLSRRGAVTKRMDLELAHQTIYGLKEDSARSLNREIYAGQYFITLDRKMTKIDKLQLTYLFVDNQYTGNPGDDSVVRLTWSHFFKTK